MLRLAPVHCCSPHGSCVEPEHLILPAAVEPSSPSLVSAAVTCLHFGPLPLSIWLSRPIHNSNKSSEYAHVHLKEENLLMFASAVVCLAVRRCLRGQVTPRIAAALKQRCSPVGFAAHLSAVWIGHRTAEALGGMQPREISGLRTAAMTDRTAAQSCNHCIHTIYVQHHRICIK
mgnify:FL=1